MVGAARPIPLPNQRCPPPRPDGTRYPPLRAASGRPRARPLRSATWGHPPPGIDQDLRHSASDRSGSQFDRQPVAHIGGHGPPSSLVGHGSPLRPSTLPIRPRGAKRAVLTPDVGITNVRGRSRSALGGAGGLRGPRVGRVQQDNLIAPPECAPGRSRSERTRAALLRSAATVCHRDGLPRTPGSPTSSRAPRWPTAPSTRTSVRRRTSFLAGAAGGAGGLLHRRRHRAAVSTVPIDRIDRGQRPSSSSTRQRRMLPPDRASWRRWTSASAALRRLPAWSTAIGRRRLSRCKTSCPNQMSERAGSRPRGDAERMAYLGASYQDGPPASTRCFAVSNHVWPARSARSNAPRLGPDDEERP